MVLVEKTPSLGGRVSQLYKYFPKLCYPTCGLEINLKRLKMNKRIRVLTLAEVSAVTGKSGNYTATVKKPLEGIKIAGYVGCQTNRPFGVLGESFENPKYLDKLVETVGGIPLEKYEEKVTCCGTRLHSASPRKARHKSRRSSSQPTITART